MLVHRSTDRGSTWTTTSLNNDVYDRPWIAHRGNSVFILTRGFDQVPYLYSSTDGGQSFGPPVVVLGSDPSGSADGDLGSVVLQHLSVGADGTLYVLQERTAGIYVSRLVPGLAARFVTYGTAQTLVDT